jgi:hypothetical protein
MSEEGPAARVLAENEISGEKLKAFLTAFDALLRRDDFAPHEKRLENYNVSFSETPTEVEVTFVAKRNSKEAGTHSGRSKFGQDIRFHVSKKDHSVVKVSFFR